MLKKFKIFSLNLGLSICGVVLFCTNLLSQTTATVDITNPAEGDILRETVSIEADISVTFAGEYPLMAGQGWRSSNFGYRNVRVGSRYHQGIDIAIPQGREVRASMGGTAYFRWRSGYGYSVVIDHGNGIFSIYAHLQPTGGVSGNVTAGQRIGYSSDSGAPGSYHLHFGMWNTGGAQGVTHENVWDHQIGRLYAINPDNYLPTARIRIRSAIDGNALNTQNYAAGTTYINYSTNWNTESVEDGEHNVSVNPYAVSTVGVLDANGNPVQQETETEIGNDSINVTVDNTPPIAENEQPKDGEVIVAEEVPYKVNISAQLRDPEKNGYASGINQNTIRLNTPQGKFNTNHAVNYLDYGEYGCSITCKGNANEPGHDLKV